jgi:hypothetical protein
MAWLWKPATMEGVVEERYDQSGGAVRLDNLVAVPFGNDPLIMVIERAVAVTCCIFLFEPATQG